MEDRNISVLVVRVLAMVEGGNEVPRGLKAQIWSTINRYGVKPGESQAIWSG
jgi:hypothetical protein